MDAPTSPQADASFLNVDGPPSSPFVTEIEPQTWLPSTSWKPQHSVLVEESNTIYMGDTPVKPHNMSLNESIQDKENVPQVDNPRGSDEKTTSSVNTTPVKSSQHDQSESRDVSLDGAMGHQSTSTRKVRATPRKTPLKAQHSVNTPHSHSRGDPFERSNAFQLGLDMRSTVLPPRDDTVMSVDDTCFTAFSEIPDMTQFARLGQSPTKSMRTPRADAAPTPRTSRKRSSPSRSPSPTPRRLKTPSGVGPDGTTFLIDFTEQIHGLGGQRRSPAKSATESNLLQYINNQRSPDKGTSRHSLATPSKPNSILNLLDFELPPAPTPRSIPTITVRELESLKSSYLSQISSLKATLSGREAEVESLKRAVGDAERRAGDAQETLREEKCRREHVEEEKAGWEKRGQEVENVLRNVKEEVLKSEAEKEAMSQQISDLSNRLEESESRTQKAEERFAETLAAHAAGADATATDDQVQHLVSLQMDAKIEAVSRELHAVYKEKHERKVATLKKSYEARSEKKCSELTSRLAALEQQHDELLAARDATFTGPHAVPEQDCAAWKTQIEEHKATIARMAQEMDVSRAQQAQLERELQAERIEKGDLVAAVDEMLALQSQSAPPPPAALSVVEDFRKSIGRPATQPSGLKPPASSSGTAGSKIGRGGAASGSLGRSTAGSGAAGKSRMLANIERMGRTGGAAPAAGTE